MGKVTRGLRRLLHLVTRPVRAARGRGQIVLQPYRGYGSRDEVFLIGRAFRQPGSSRPYAESLWRDLIDLGRRFLRRSIADAPLVARFCGAEQRLRTDRDGYFRVHLKPAERPPADRLWHQIELELVGPGVKAAGELFVPPPGCRYVVISDIDDTVTETGVANKLVMLWRLFMQGVEGRIVFPGMVAFLQALHHGASGTELNPMLYVSRAPWNLYEVLDAFFNLHAIPVGPVLFLREWGMTWESPLPRRAKGHKLELIRHMLALYGDLPFILIGDSGQRDPEIYAQLVAEHPGRVRAIYIRNVSVAPERRRAIEDLAIEVVEVGSSLLLAADSMAMARHAAEHGLIAPQALAEVRGEKERATEEAVQEGASASALEQDEAAPASLVVETDEGQHAAARRARRHDEP